MALHNCGTPNLWHCFDGNRKMNFGQQHNDAVCSRVNAIRLSEAWLYSLLPILPSPWPIAFFTIYLVVPDWIRCVAVEVVGKLHIVDLGSGRVARDARVIIAKVVLADLDQCTPWPRLAIRSMHALPRLAIRSMHALPRLAIRKVGGVLGCLSLVVGCWQPSAAGRSDIRPRVDIGCQTNDKTSGAQERRRRRG